MNINPTWIVLALTAINLVATLWGRANTAELKYWFQNKMNEHMKDMREWIEKEFMSREAVSAEIRLLDQRVARVELSPGSSKSPILGTNRVP